MLELNYGDVLNGAGLIKTPEEAVAAANTALDGIVVGSFTEEERPGNPDPQIRMWPSGNSGNSVGLKNGGIEALNQDLSLMIATAQASGKFIILSAAGENPRQFAAVAEVGKRWGVDGIEINLSCPNRLDEEEGSTALDVISDDPLRSGEAVEAVMRAAPGIFTIVKLGPILQIRLLREQADMCKAMGVHAVSGPNTIPGCYDLDGNGNQVIGAQFFGGAGLQLHQFALGQTRRLRQMLPPEIDIIAMGGIRNGKDAGKFLQVGATAVAAHSAARPALYPYKPNFAFFDALASEVKPLVKIPA